MKTLKALLVDDVASMRKFLKYGLEKTFPNVVVDEASNGKEAQAKLEKSDYDLVLSDWEMPLVNGEELLRWLRQHPTLNKTPFIMITSRDDKPSVLKAMHAGVDSYVVKPFTAEGLAQKVITVVEKADRREQERFEVHGSLNLHFGDQVAHGSIIDLGMGGIFGLFGRNNPLPRILQKVLVDIKLENSHKVDGLEAFVIRMQAAEAFIDAENVKIAVKFCELPDVRSKELQQVLDSLAL